MTYEPTPEEKVIFAEVAEEALRLAMRKMRDAGVTHWHAFGIDFETPKGKAQLAAAIESSLAGMRDDYPTGKVCAEPGCGKPVSLVLAEHIGTRALSFCEEHMSHTE